MSLDYSSIESYAKKRLVRFGFDNLVDLMDHMLSINPYSKENDEFKRKMFKEQVIINFPILYVSSIWIYLYALENGCETILFATRDCCQHYKIFKALFPLVNCHYFHCSRNMFEGAIKDRNVHYRRYVESLIHDPKKTLYVDEHGSGERVHNYFKKEFGSTPHCVLVSSRFKDEDDFKRVMDRYIDTSHTTSLVFDARGSPIEMLNYDLVGTLQTYNEHGPVRNKLEYEYSLIEVYHKSIDLVVKNMEPLKLEDITRNCKDSLRKLLVKLFDCILNDKPIISKNIRHIGKHGKNIDPDDEDK